MILREVIIDISGTITYGNAAHNTPATLGRGDEFSAIDRLDIVINNSGLTRDGLLIRMRDEDWHDIMAINLHAAFYLTRACLREMLRQRWGRIVNISSIVAEVGNPGQANYIAAKAAVIVVLDTRFPPSIDAVPVPFNESIARRVPNETR